MLTAHPDRHGVLTVAGFANDDAPSTVVEDAMKEPAG
jgi:hypothetical protein